MAKSVSTRRDLLMLAGVVGGGAATYRGMEAFAATAPPRSLKPGLLEGSGAGASVVVLGAGIAGLVAATELRRAGYDVHILEYNDRPGGRSWTIRGGDVIEEMGGERQVCGFGPGQYFNPGPMRIAYDHHHFLDYCSQFGVALESFTQQNGAAYFHSNRAFGGKPQRAREVQADFEGGIAELLAKAARGHKLDQALTKEDLEVFRESLRDWGALDKDFRYRKGPASSGRRGALNPVSGDAPLLAAQPTEPVALADILKSGFWKNLAAQHSSDWAPTMFQPVGGMDMLVRAMAKPLESAIRYRAKVTRIDQGAGGVSVVYSDLAGGGATRTLKADWCVCTIPASILSQIPLQVGGKMQQAISSIWYASSVKVGLQFKRRFWEQDERIYGGITFTDGPINQIVYPSHGYGSTGKGVLTGAFVVSLGGFQPITSFEMSSRPAAERVAWAVREGAKIHPQYPTEFDNGVTVAWHRNPSSLGCFAMWHEDLDPDLYDALRAVDGRIVLAGEHCSQHAGWQEGAITSALDAALRLHERVRAGAAAGG